MDLFGGSISNNSGGGLDLFSSAPVTTSIFPAFIAYEDSVLDLGFDLKREGPN